MAAAARGSGERSPGQEGQARAAVPAAAPSARRGTAPGLDRCGGCRVCAAAEGEACGGALGRPCAARAPAPRRRGTAACCGDCRTYPSLSALRAENRVARVRGAFPAVAVRKWGTVEPQVSGGPCALCAVFRSEFRSRGSPCCIARAIQRLLGTDFLPSLGIRLPVPMWLLPNFLPIAGGRRLPFYFQIGVTGLVSCDRSEYTAGDRREEGEGKRREREERGDA